MQVMARKKKEPMATMQQGRNHRKLKAVHFPGKRRNQNLKLRMSKSSITSENSIDELVDDNPSTQLSLHIVPDDEVRKQGQFQQEKEVLPVYKECKSPKEPVSKNILLMSRTQKHDITVDSSTNMKTKHKSQKRQGPITLRSGRRYNIQSSHCNQHIISNNSQPKNICAVVQFQDNQEEYMTKNLDAGNNTSNIVLHTEVKFTSNKGVDVDQSVSVEKFQNHLAYNSDESRIHDATKAVTYSQNVYDEDCNKKVTRASMKNSTLTEGKIQNCEIERTRFVNGSELNNIQHSTACNLEESFNENLNPQIDVKNTILDKEDENVYNKRSILPHHPRNIVDICAKTLQSHQTVPTCNRQPKTAALTNIISLSVMQENSMDITHHNINAKLDASSIIKSEGESGNGGKCCRKRGRPRKKLRGRRMLPAEVKNNLQHTSTELNTSFKLESNILLVEHQHENSNVNYMKEVQDKQEELQENHLAPKPCEMKRIIEADSISVPKAVSATGNSISEEHVTTNDLNVILEENMECGHCEYRMDGTQVLSPASLEIRDILSTSRIEEELNLPINDRYGISGKKTAYYFRRIATNKLQHPRYKRRRRKRKSMEQMQKISKCCKLNESNSNSQSAIGADVIFSISDSSNKKTTKLESEPKVNETMSSYAPELLETEIPSRKHKRKPNNVNLSSQMQADSKGVQEENSEPNGVNADTVLKKFIKKTGRRKRKIVKENDTSTLTSDNLNLKSQDRNEILKMDTSYKEEKKEQQLLQKSPKTRTHMSLIENKSEELSKVHGIDKNERSKNNINHVDLNKYGLKQVRIEITRLEELPLIQFLALLNKKKYNEYMAKTVKKTSTLKLNNEEPLILRQLNQHAPENNIQHISKYNENDPARTTENCKSDRINNVQTIETDNANEIRTRDSISKELSLMSHCDETITPPQQVPDEIFDVEENIGTATKCGHEKQDHIKWISESTIHGIYYNNTSKTDYNHTMIEEYFSQSDEEINSALMNPLQENTLISINKSLPNFLNTDESEYSQEYENEQNVCNNDFEEKENSPQKCDDTDNSLLRTGPFKDRHLPNASTGSEDDAFAVIAPHVASDTENVPYKGQNADFNSINTKCRIHSGETENQRKEEGLLSSAIEVGLLPPTNISETHDQQINSSGFVASNKINSQPSKRLLKRPMSPTNNICCEKRLKIISSGKINVMKTICDGTETLGCIKRSYEDGNTIANSEILDSDCCKNPDFTNSVDKDISLRINKTTTEEKLCAERIQSTSKLYSPSLRNSLSKVEEKNNNEDKGEDEEDEGDDEDEEGDDESSQTEDEDASCKSDVSEKFNHEDQQTVRKWHCNLCNEKFALIRNFLRHKYYSHKDETSVHICDNCTKVITSVAMVNIHVCTNVTSWICKRCNLYFPNSLYLMQHNNRYHFELVGPHKCNICCLTFLTKYMLEKHKTIQHPMGINNNDTDRLRCLKDSSHSNLTSSKTHMVNQEKKLLLNAKLENDKLHTMKCMKKLNLANVFLIPNTNEGQQNRTKDLGITVALSDSKQQFGCELCDVMYSSKLDIKLHLMEHHNVSVRMCELCGDFYVLTRVINHLIERHIVFDNSLLKNRQSSDLREINYTQNQNIPCELLKILGEKRFHYLEQYRQFYKKQRNHYFFCETCLEEYISIDGYIFHYLKMHDESCILCNVEFKNSVEALYHKIENHKSIASYLWAVQKMIKSIMIAKKYSRILDSMALRLNKVQLCDNESENAELVNPEDENQWNQKLCYLYTKINELKNECSFSSEGGNVSTEQSTTCNTIDKDIPLAQLSDTNVDNTTLSYVNSTEMSHITQDKNALLNREEIPIIVLTEKDLEMYKNDIGALGSRMHSSCNIFSEEYYTTLLVSYMNHTFS